jgi:hypothetical protein
MLIASHDGRSTNDFLLRVALIGTFRVGRTQVIERGAGTPFSQESITVD